MKASKLSVRARGAAGGVFVTRVRATRSRQVRIAALKCAVEQLEERILFGYFAAYDTTRDPFPAFPNQTCPPGSGPGAAADANPPQSSGGGTTGPAAGPRPQMLAFAPGSSGPAMPAGMGTAPHGVAAPGGSAGASTTSAPVREYDGVPVINSTDLASDAFGSSFGITRSWSGLNSYALFGNGWSVAGLPYMTVAGTGGDLRLAVVDGGTTSFTFNPTTYAVWGSYNVKLQLLTGLPRILRMTDAEGNTTDFYDVFRSGSTPTPQTSWDLASLYGQLKSYTSANGTTTIATNYDSNGYLQTLTRSDSSTGQSERLVFMYAAVTNSEVTANSATPPTLTSTVTQQQLVNGNWQSVERSNYALSNSP
jgi:hypothetical protein